MFLYVIIKARTHINYGRQGHKMKLNKKFKVLAIGAALALSIGAVGCSKQEEAPKEDTQQEQAKAEVKTIKGDEVVEAMKDANTVVIDARDASEYEAGHIKGALNVFVDEAESKLGDLEQYKDKKVIVYCNSGKKSGKLAQLLVDNGFTDVSNADGVKQYEYELVQGKEEPKAEKAEVKTMKGDEVVEAMKDTANTVVIDARDAKDFAKGHIDGAINVFVDEAEDKLGELEQYKDKKVIVYCNSGNKSGKLAQFLVDNGFTDVYNADGVKQYEYNLVKGE